LAGSTKSFVTTRQGVEAYFRPETRFGKHGIFL